MLMSVQKEKNVAESVVSEAHAGDSVYASLFEKINLNPVTLSGQQITRLAELPPAYNLQRSAQLLQQLMVLFPDNPRVTGINDEESNSGQRISAMAAFVR